MSNGVGEIPLHEQVGFDYIATVRELLKRLTYAELTGRIGYSSVGSISSILKGNVPSHVHGEALWALYIEMIGRKPPLVQKNASQPNPTKA